MSRKEELQQAQELAGKITQAHLAYRAILKALVGFGHFENIDAWATDDRISLSDAAVRYGNQELQNANARPIRWAKISAEKKARGGKR